MKQQPKKKKRQQPAPRLGLALIDVEVSYWGIDPDIARNAIEARIKQKLKERPGEITPAKIEKIGEDFVLASLANIPPEKWPDDFAQLI